MGKWIEMTNFQTGRVRYLTKRQAQKEIGKDELADWLYTGQMGEWIMIEVDESDVPAKDRAKLKRVM